MVYDVDIKANIPLGAVCILCILYVLIRTDCRNVLCPAEL